MSFDDDAYDYDHALSDRKRDIETRKALSSGFKTMEKKSAISLSAKKEKEKKNFRAAKGNTVLTVGRGSTSESIEIQIGSPSYYGESSWREQGSILLSPEMAEEMAQHLLSLSKLQKEKRVEEEKRKVAMIKSLEEARQEIREKRALLNPEDDLQSGL